MNDMIERPRCGPMFRFPRSEEGLRAGITGVWTSVVADGGENEGKGVDGNSDTRRARLSGQSQSDGPRGPRRGPGAGWADMS